MIPLALSYPEFDPVAISLGPLTIKWYGLAYLAGLIIGWLYIRRLLTTPKLWRANTPPFNLSQVDDLLLYITIGVIVGGRLGYVLLYEPGSYLAAPLDVFAVWKGGMSFHGALAGCGLSIWLFGRRNGVNALSAMDLGSAAVPLGIFFGRIANFINGELFGRVSDVPWAMVFPHAKWLHPTIEPATRHPSQLYEAALEGLVLFLVLRVLTHRFGALKSPGLITGAFLAGYAVARSFSEMFREPHADHMFNIGPLTAGQIYCLPMLAGGLYLIWRARREAPHFGGKMSTDDRVPPRETPLAARLRDRIRRDGPISVSDFMRTCLLDPEHGYYRHRPALGSAGDFVTAPEISQVFGELIGLWCAVVWQQMGSPPRFNLVELGPGRGTLMRDALRATRIVPGFGAAATLHLVECNAALRETQRATLAPTGAALHFHDDAATLLGAVASLPADPTLVIANEFLDALPIEQAEFLGGEWRARIVTLDDALGLSFGNDAASRLAVDAPRAPREGDVLETSTARGAVASSLTRRAALAPLAGLFIDYGHASTGYGETLQGVAAQTFVSPFHAPGETDLSAHVDFPSFAAACRQAGTVVDGPVPQAAFLGALGIVERASRLMSENPDQAGTIEAGVQRLMAPTGMGSRFLVLGLRSAHLAPLPGLA